MTDEGAADDAANLRGVITQIEASELDANSGQAPLSGRSSWPPRKTGPQGLGCLQGSSSWPFKGLTWTQVQQALHLMEGNTIAA